MRLHNRGFLFLLVVIFFSAITVSGCSGEKDNVEPPGFDGTAAFSLLKEQVEIGPRYPGSQGHAKLQEWIVNNIEKYADDVIEQDFSVVLQNEDEETDLKNIIAVFDSDSSKYVMLACHYDTRPIADYEVKAEDRDKPIPGANDGASGVAVLVQLAKMFHEKKPDVGIIMVFFDAEDWGTGREYLCYGSKHFAETYEKEGLFSKGNNPDIMYGILVDMIGDKDLKIYKEIYSARNAPEIVEKVWKTAHALGYEEYFIDEERHNVYDDHVPCTEAGIKTIDIIDFDYAHWHTLEDTPDKCSPKSLEIVGNVVAGVVYSEKPATDKKD